MKRICLAILGLEVGILDASLSDFSTVGFPSAKDLGLGSYPALAPEPCQNLADYPLHSADQRLAASPSDVVASTAICYRGDIRDVRVCGEDRE